MNPYFPVNETLPDGVTGGYFGENGTYAYKLDAIKSAQGNSIPNCMWYRFGLVQSSDISTVVSAVYKNELNASNNGLEGFGCNAMITKTVNNQNMIIWETNITTIVDQSNWDYLNDYPPKWKRRTWHIQPPRGRAGDYLFICFVAKASHGSVTISNAECRNSYTRIYPMALEYSGNSGQYDSDTLKEVTEAVTIGMGGLFGGPLTTTYNKVRKLWYKKTIPVYIRPGEEFVITSDIVMQGRIIYDAGFPNREVEIGVLCKMLNDKGGYDYFESVSYRAKPINTEVIITSSQHLNGQKTHRAIHTYTQAELVLYIKSDDNASVPSWLEHQEGYVEIKVTGSVQNG